jgi:hypothetical protein
MLAAVRRSYNPFVGLIDSIRTMQARPCFSTVRVSVPQPPIETDQRGHRLQEKRLNNIFFEKRYTAYLSYFLARANRATRSTVLLSRVLPLIVQ